MTFPSFSVRLVGLNLLALDLKYTKLSRCCTYLFLIAFGFSTCICPCNLFESCCIPSSPGNKKIIRNALLIIDENGIGLLFLDGNGITLLERGASFIL